jgi:D-serine deaminase-like pyridoxal phosphate-dependent protein
METVLGDGVCGGEASPHETHTIITATIEYKKRMATADEQYRRYRRALDGIALPAAFVDLDAFERNAARVRTLLEGSHVTLRIGSKSLRCMALIERALDALGDRAGGVLAFTAAEAAFLVARGVRDLVVAYPTAHPSDAHTFATLNRDGATVRAMIDDVAHVAALDRAARDVGAVVPVMIDVDMAWRAPGLGSAVALGVRRSPLHEAEAVVALARMVRDHRSLRFDGVMGYEAQIAGLADRTTQQRMSVQSALVKTLSRTQVRARRAAVREALTRAGLAPTIFNGGGTGSLAWSAHDPSLTEVAAGSAFVGATLFDGFDGFAPEGALWFALQVTRRPSRNVVTCLGGGYIASGPPGWDRLPRPVLPTGLTLLAWEGAGEVQTPLRVAGSNMPAVGDPVMFRHAKAGELAERFTAYHLVRGDTIERTVLTYRGDGGCFV